MNARTGVRAFGALFMCLIAACGQYRSGGDDDDKPTSNTRASVSLPRVTVSMKATTSIDHVSRLVLRIPPTILTHLDGQQFVLTDENNSTGIRQECTVDEQGGQDCRTIQSFRDLVLLDAALPDPVHTAIIARENKVVNADYQAALFQAIRAERGVRDSYLILDDQRECEVHGLRTGEGYNYLWFDLPPPWVRMTHGEHWRLLLTVDLAGIDPANCAQGYTLQVQSYSVEAVPM